MNNNYAKKQVRRTAKNIIILNIIIIIAIIIFVNKDYRALRSIYMEEETVSYGSKLAEMYQSREIYVKSYTEEFFDTGYEMLEDNVVVDKYYAFYLNDMYIICRTDTKMTQESYSSYKISGLLVEPDTEEKKILNAIIGEISDQLDVTRTEAQGYVSAYIIDVGAPRLLHQILFGVAGVVIIFCVSRIIIAIRDIIDYTLNKKYKKLGKESGRGPEIINEEITAELGNEEKLYKFGHAKITENWVVSESFANFEILPKTDVIWIYKLITQHRTNGIPTGKSFSIEMLFKNKKRVSIAQKNEKIADETVNKLVEIFPGAIVGFSNELLRMFNKDINKFIELQIEKATAVPEVVVSEETIIENKEIVENNDAIKYK